MVDGESEDNGWQRFLMLYRRVVSSVGADLATDVLVGLASAVRDGVVLVIRDEGRCHMIEGRFRGGCADLLSRSCSPKVTASSRMQESTADTKPVRWFEFFQIGVIVVLDSPQEFQPHSPAARVLLVGALGNSRLAGLSRAKFAIQEVRSSGTCTIFRGLIDG